MIRFDRHQWDAAHEALKVNWLSENANKLVAKIRLQRVSDHLSRRLIGVIPGLAT